MNRQQKKKLISTNAAVLAVGLLVSFVLPLIAESMTEGRGNFLKAVAHIFPLICTIAASTGLISKAIGEPTE